MKTFLTTNFKWIALIIALIFLAWVILRGCNSLPDHKDGKAIVDSVTAAYSADKAKDLAVINALSFENAAKGREVDSLIMELIDSRKDLQDRGKLITGTLARGAQLRIIHDTASIISNCDTLAQQVADGMLVVGGYEDLTDSLIKAGKAQARIKDSMALSYFKLYRKSDAALGIVTKQYNALYPDYAKARRGLNFNKGLSRVLAAAVIAGAVKIFIIK